MSLPLSSQLDLYDLFIATLQDQAPQLTDTLDGSDIDLLAGVFSVAVTEAQRNTIAQFNKTFFDLANGPEITGGPDDLQTLAVDHFGSEFARPRAIAAVDVATFSRANNSKGAIPILTGTIVKTQVDASGNAQRYATVSDVNLTASSVPSDLTVNVGIVAVVAGSDGSAVAGAINVIESTLLDSSIVVTNAGNATGEDAQNDSTYRETIRNLIESIAGATLRAIEAKAKTVQGVIVATAIEQAITVIQYNRVTHQTIGNYFNVVNPVLFIADATGTATPALLALVRLALEPVRACGISIDVRAASSSVINWTGHITLNPSGPNYSTLSSDTTAIKTDMKNYINNLAVGSNFIVSVANAAILALWGPSGTNDITAFTTSVPSGDVAGGGSIKFVSGTIGIS